MTTRYRHSLVSLCVFLFSISVLAAPAPNLSAAAAQFRAHPARTIAFWNRFMLKPFEDRFGAAPAPFVDVLRLDNRLQGVTDMPLAKEPDAALVRDIKKALVDLPPRVKLLLRDKFVGVYFVTNLGGSAITETVFDGVGREAFGVIAIDATALNRKANEWATWKESSPYKQDPIVKIEATLEEHIYNDRASALQYILLHEMGHVLAVGRNDLVGTSTDLTKLVDLSAKPFVALTWLVQKGKWTTRYDRTTYPQRTFIQYYAPKGSQLSAPAALLALKNLEKTNFPSPYAGVSPTEDFAESFASYVHTQWMRKPWSIRYLNQGKVEFELKPCWDTARCEQRQKLLEALLSAK